MRQSTPVTLVVATLVALSVVAGGGLGVAAAENPDASDTLQQTTDDTDTEDEDNETSEELEDNETSEELEDNETSEELEDNETSAEENTTSFGQTMAAFITDLRENSTDGDNVTSEKSTGQLIATFAVENNPGNAPDHAGPKDNRTQGPPAETGPDGEQGPPADSGPDSDRGPPADAGPGGDDEADDEEGDDSEETDTAETDEEDDSDDSDSGGPPSDAGNAGGGPPN